ncbi:Pyruvate, water dikinase [Halothece sp. PCC 7418]|uniref:putative PEP-binding protein n=1 Tax=Halothece sp. (strain PCC 7418) TaxID=65093 RepID=UPI0002A05C35|nr:putative PEP-binding protein [Halothece sp. PCC 7418]AFZ43305.1 Pyruvate, water dikinase [Halothece sp. PCC 7418]
MTNDIYDLDSINSSHRQVVGDKAIALSWLSQQGFPVSSGVVVGSQVLGSVLSREESFASLKQVIPTLNDYERLQQTAQTLSELVSEFVFDPDWYQELYQKIASWETQTLIFRPSVVFPPSHPPVSGLFASYCCLFQKDEIEIGLKRVWRSFFYARNLFYWQQQGISWESLGLAVLMQPISSAIASGILEVREQQCYLQAVQGLGHSLVWGEASPETYHVDLTLQEIKGHQLAYQTRIYQLNPSLEVTTVDKEAEKAVLSSRQFSELIKLAVSLQGKMKQNFRCEWTFFPESNSDNGQDESSLLYLTQFSSEISMVTKSDSQSRNFKANEPVTPTRSRLLVKGIGSACGTATGQVYVVGKDDDQRFPPQGILVTTNVNSQTLPLIKRAKGLIVEQGGVTSHGAILARELNIPAVVGAEGAVEVLAGETEVMVDGDQGEVLRPPLEAETKTKTLPTSERPERTVLATQLLVNVSQRDRSQELSQLPVDGVGLIRSDLMLLELLEEHSLSTWLSSSFRDQFIQRLADTIGELAEAFFPRPVFYRSTDWLSVESSEIPLLGARGAYSYRKHPEFFSAQMFALRHLQQHHGYNNINLIIPFVRSVEEVEFCKSLLTEIGVEKSCQLWIMAEVPSVVYLLPEYAKAGVEGIAIGTNDLTQLLLGVDREQGALQGQYNERHPALKAALKGLITTARSQGIFCSVCGQGVVLYPELVSDLVRWGVTSISVEESGVEETYGAIARSEKQLLLEAARNQLGRDRDLPL